jgi:hypothetical protein
MILQLINIFRLLRSQCLIIVTDRYNNKLLAKSMYLVDNHTPVYYYYIHLHEYSEILIVTISFHTDTPVIFNINYYSLLLIILTYKETS